MAEFEHQREISADPQAVFEVATSMRTLSSWAPEGVEVEQADTPGKLHAWVSSGSEIYDAEGFVSVDRDERRLEWGGTGDEGYDGWLQIDPDERDSERHSIATMHLTFAGEQPEALGGEFTEEADRRIEQSLDRLAALVAERLGGE
ncbi:SRPBCC family protein [Qaidamihabitans albus]|uniref:SRPBCC family protein n=1 Tax=Qaidamihabitans albus TaxID=2795733 RepID=UPI0018F1355D|nr:SRPBCC family protein [Qaidamihabitans albus]